MAVRYTTEELRDIGTRNADRLAPASAILGMYEYELRRAAEDEALFNNAMIQATKAAKEISGQQSRLNALEKTVKACAGHHDNKHTVSIPGSTHMLFAHSLADLFTRRHLSNHPFIAQTYCHEPS